MIVAKPPGKRRSTWLAVLAAVCGVTLALALLACGDSGASQEELNQAKREASAHTREQLRIKNIQRELRRLRRDGGGTRASDDVVVSDTNTSATSSTSSSSTCGDGLSVNSVTTCPFAKNVQSEYYDVIGSGSGTVYAYSPVTDRGYTMYCTAGSPHECTGGKGAAVYFP